MKRLKFREPPRKRKQATVLGPTQLKQQINYIPATHCPRYEFPVLNLLQVAGAGTRDIGVVTGPGYVLIANAELPGNLRHRLRPDQIMELRSAQPHHIPLWATDRWGHDDSFAPWLTNKSYSTPIRTA